jgi:hypothetical protein
MRVFNRLPNPEDIFHRRSRGQNKADVDALAKHEEFFNGEILKKQKYLRDLSKETKRK